LRLLRSSIWLGCLLTAIWAAPTWPTIAVFGDVHGAYEELATLLEKQGVVANDGAWHGGDLTLVSLGDVIDRGDEGRQVLDLLMRLQDEASAAGGAVYMVLGNHELMNLSGELDYVSRGDYAQFAGDEKPGMRDTAFARLIANGRYEGIDPMAARVRFDTTFPPGFFARLAAFSPSGRYGQWLLRQTPLLMIGDQLFVHGGLPPAVAREPAHDLAARLMSEVRTYVSAWHSALDEGLVDPDTPFRERVDTARTRASQTAHEATIASLAGTENSLAFAMDGPLWYRGQALCHPAYENDVLTAALEQQAAARVVMGHTVTPTREVTSRFEGRVLLTDTGMLTAVYRGRAALTYLDGDSVSVAYADSDARSAPADDPVRVGGGRRGGMDDAALGAFLARAKVGRETTPTTERRKVDLEADGLILAAERYTRHEERELAAYAVDRLLDLRLVPVTVPRTIDDRAQALQFWPDGLITHAERERQGNHNEGWCPLKPQFDLMAAFDALIGMPVRRADRLAYVASDPMIVLTGHAEAFGRSKSLPSHLRRVPLVVSRTLATRLEALDEKSLAVALPMLDDRDIQALLARRDALLRASALLDAAHQE